MSSIDDRVVRMEFDNKQFESGVSTTMSTLEKLNEALKFRNGTAGFEDVQKASASINFAPLNDSLWQVQQNFSFFGEFVRNVFDRISNQIINLGSTVVRELTTAPLQAGFSEYELQMGSTQTIMASTGKSIEEVTGYLDELNEYADKTIYSFSDMTANIGKFTNAGVDLDTAVKAIQGISNEAALSGANAQEASRAMYNFAQALSSGSVKLIDWKSIENANMATQGFKEQLLETAVEIGTVEKTADGMYRVLSKNSQGGTMDGVIDATHNFNDSLSYQWMTTDVLTTTLGKYADETTEIGQAAFAAATEVKTFSQLIDTVKESLGSGWTKSFSYIFGNLEEAKVLWTGVNNEIESILGPIAEAREAMLKFWHDNGGRTSAIKAIADAWQGVKAIMGAVSDAFSMVFPPLTGERLVVITETIGKLATKFKETATSARVLNNVSKIVRGIANSVKLVGSVAKTAFNYLSPFLKLFVDFGGSLFDAAAAFGDFISCLTRSRTGISTVQSAFGRLRDSLRYIVEGIENLITSLFDFINIDIQGNPLTSLFDVVADFISSFDLVSILGTGFSSAIEGISSAFHSLFSGATIDFGSGVEFIGGVFSSLGSAVSEWVPKIIEYLGSQEFRDALKNADLLAGGGLLLSLTGLSEGLGGLVDKLRGADKSKGFFSGILELLQGMLKPFVDLASSTVDKFNTFLDDIGKHLDAFQTLVSPAKLTLIAGAIFIMAHSIQVLDGVSPESAGHALAVFITSITLLIVALTAAENLIDFRALSVKLPAVMLGIAAAIGVMALIVKSFSGFSWEALANGLMAIGSLLFGVAAFLNIVSGIKVRFSVITSLGVVAVAVGILGLVAANLTQFDGGSLAVSVAAIGALLFEIAAFTNIISGTKVKLSVLLELVALSNAIVILSEAVSVFSGIDSGGLARSVATMGALLFEIAAFTNVVSGTKVNLRSIIAIIAVAGAIKIIESVISTLSGIDSGSLTKSVATIGAIVFELAAFLSVVSGAKISLRSIGAIAVLTYAIKSITTDLNRLGVMSNESSSRALTSLGVALGVLTIALIALGAGSPMMIVGAAAVYVLAQALKVFIEMLTAFTNATDDFGKVTKAIGVVVLAMIAFGVGAFALGVASIPLLLFMVVVVSLATALPLLAEGFGALAKSLTLFVGSAAAVGSLVAVLKSTANLLTTVIEGAVVGLIVGIAKGLVGAAAAILLGLGIILDALSVAIVEIGNFLLNNLPYVMSICSVILITVISSLTTYIPLLIEVIGEFFVALTNAIVTWLPVVAQALVTGTVSLINAVANGIRDNTEAILGAVRNILSAVIELVLTALADIVRLIPVIGDELAAHIESGRDAVRNALAPESFESMGNEAVNATTAGIESGSGPLSDAASGVGTEAHDSFFESFLGGTEDISGQFMEPILTGMQGFNSEFSGVADGNVESYLASFLDASGAPSGEWLSGDVLSGIDSNTGLFDTTGTDQAGVYAKSLGSRSVFPEGAQLASGGVSGVGSKWSGYFGEGTNSATGFGSGMISDYALSYVRNAAAKMAQTGLNAVQATINSGSPSKETMKLGKYASQGFAIGISSLTDVVYKESAEVGNSALDGLRDSLGGMSKYLDEDLELDPTIRPVMDLSEIQNGVTQLNRIVDNGVSTPLLGVGLDAYPQSVMSAILGPSSVNGLAQGITTVEEKTYNIYIDGDLLATDERLKGAFDEFMFELARKADM